MHHCRVLLGSWQRGEQNIKYKRNIRRPTRAGHSRWQKCHAVANGDEPTLFYFFLLLLHQEPQVDIDTFPAPFTDCVRVCDQSQHSKLSVDQIPHSVYLCPTGFFFSLLHCLSPKVEKRRQEIYFKGRKKKKRKLTDNLAARNTCSSETPGTHTYISIQKPTWNTNRLLFLLVYFVCLFFFLLCISTNP